MHLAHTADVARHTKGITLSQLIRPGTPVIFGSFALLYSQMVLPTPSGAGVVEMGFLGAPVPEQYGGLGLDYLSYGLIVEEIGRGDSAMRTVISVVTTQPHYHLDEVARASQPLTPFLGGQVFAALYDSAGGEITAPIAASPVDVLNEWDLQPKAAVVVPSCSGPQHSAPLGTERNAFTCPRSGPVTGTLNTPSLEPSALPAAR